MLLELQVNRNQIDRLSFNHRLETLIQKNNDQVGASLVDDLQERVQPLPEFGSFSFSPRVASLVTNLYADLESMHKRSQYIKHAVGIQPHAARTMLDQVPPHDFDAEYDSMILSVQAKAPEYFRELADVGVAASLTESLNLKGLGAWVRVYKPHSEQAKKLGYTQKGASYYPVLDTMVIVDELPTDRTIWESLAVNSYLPDVLANIDHEATHNEQMRGLLPKVDVLFIGVNTLAKLPREIQAFLAEASSPTHPYHYQQPSGLDKATLLSKIRSRYLGDVDNTYAALAEKVFEQFNFLRVINYDDKKLATLVRACSFDENRMTFPNIDEAVEAELASFGIADPELLQGIIANLKVMHEMRFYYARARAQQIAISHLHLASGSYRWSDIDTSGQKQ